MANTYDEGKQVVVKLLRRDCPVEDMNRWMWSGRKGAAGPLAPTLVSGVPLAVAHEPFWGTGRWGVVH